MACFNFSDYLVIVLLCTPVYPTLLVGCVNVDVVRVRGALGDHALTRVEDVLKAVHVLQIAHVIGCPQHPVQPAVLTGRVLGELSLVVTQVPFVGELVVQLPQVKTVAE